MQPPAPAPPAKPEPVVSIGIGADGEAFIRNLPMGNDEAARAKRSALAAFLNQLNGRVRAEWRGPAVTEFGRGCQKEF